MYFYELHESNDELFSDALLAHDEDFSQEEFFALVMEARGRVLAAFEEDTLVEAIARELVRAHGFIYIDDQLLHAAVNVSLVDEDNVIASIEEDDDADDDADDYRTIYLDVDRSALN